MKKLGGVSWPRKHTMSARSQGGCHFLRYTDPEAYAQPSKCPCAQVVRVNWSELKRQWLGLCCLMIVCIVDSFLLMALFERWLFCYKINNFWVCTVYKINMHFHLLEKCFPEWYTINIHFDLQKSLILNWTWLLPKRIFWHHKPHLSGSSMTHFGRCRSSTMTELGKVEATAARFSRVAGAMSGLAQWLCSVCLIIHFFMCSMYRWP